MTMTLTTLLKDESNMSEWLNKNMPKSLAHKVFSAEQVRDNEAAAAQVAKCSMFTLMQRAGEAVFKQLILSWPHARTILVLTGHGNNGGDGYIVAHLARQHGLQVALCCVDTNKNLVGDALLAQQQWHESGGQLLAWQDVDFTNFPVIVDALLGTGLNGEVKGDYQTIIKQVNAASGAVLSIDIPSGLHANKGYPLGTAVLADCTVTFVGIKSGLCTGTGKEYCGELVLDELGIGTEFLQLVQPQAQLINYASLSPLAARRINAHKGSHGKLLCIGGNRGMAGAIRMAGEAALRTGTGLLKVFCHPNSELSVGSGRPELMLASQDLEQQLKWASCIGIGPGLGQNEWSQALFTTLQHHLISHPKPLVIDADGLTILASSPEQMKNLPALVITPHPGEASRLLSCSIMDVEHDRYGAAIELANKYQACCILKGAGTLISDGSQSFVCTDGNPGMASGGMGDVLTGIVAALLAQGLPALQAAVYAVCLHGAAADKLAAKYGQRGMLATDLFETLRTLVNWK
jgi:NAD(P)H-hydrate epimerase